MYLYVKVQNSSSVSILLRLQQKIKFRCLIVLTNQNVKNNDHRISEFLLKFSKEHVIRLPFLD